MTVVDCDSHIMEPPDLWQTYLERKFRDRAIRIETDDDGIEELIIGEKVVLRERLAALGGAHIDRIELFTQPLKLRRRLSAVELRTGRTREDAR